ncbi:hypothetical protein BOTBODRAFT_170337 [Botryobasidium botryosum FD-172 SS1]|uniref:Conserved oligomeric Golgi complex subunit 1 n=1 Tax=Botryobasidium botryosum (strain FD-172 SS1) TaxID=930990 RepID=A0A067MXA8_BOTB1|nr:hypothetical protein BOTBODRAFT_170337 [Botryobasidium botryosum FD-172 SS1]
MSRKARPAVPVLSIPSDSQTNVSPKYKSYNQQSAAPLSNIVSPAATRASDIPAGNGERLGPEDVSRIDPDEMFVRFSVAEVRGVYDKLRGEADRKQEELRTMVGERYRDLLQASTSIISMSESSKRVLGAFQDMKDACAVVSETNFKSHRHRRSMSTRGSLQDDGQLAIFQSLSAHLKLLLDAPEQLWRLLEKKRHLQAAWLYLLARVVHRALVRGDENEEGESEIVWSKEGILVMEQFPIVQRQWDTISQFRSQITHRATQFLREHTVTSEIICETLISLLLLESLSIQSLLSLLLSQRSKSLRQLYSRLSSVAASSSILSAPGSPVAIAKRKGSVRVATPSLSIPSSAPRESEDGNSTYTLVEETVKSAKDAVKGVKDALRLVLELIGSTTSVVRDLFAPGEEASLSRLEKMVAETQSETSLPAAALSPSGRQPSGILAPSPSHSSGPISTLQIIHTLPSSQLLQRFLPPSVVSYTPYINIDTQKDPYASSREAHTWFGGCVADLEDRLDEWFGRLDEVKQVSEVRRIVLRDKRKGKRKANVAQGFGFDEKEKAEVRTVVDRACLRQAKRIWQRALGDLQSLAASEIDRVLGIVRDDPAQARGDLSPSTFLLSADLSFPSASSASSQLSETPSGSSFQSYKLALQQRVSLRTPLLGSVLSKLEAAARALRVDLGSFGSPVPALSLIDALMTEYRPAAEACAKGISAILRDRLKLEVAQVPSHEYDDLTISVIITLGRIALWSASSSPFFDDLGCTEGFASAARIELRSLHERTLDVWSTHSIAKAVEQSKTALSMAGSRVTAEQSAINPPFPFNLSVALMQSLNSLSSSVENLGISSSLRASSVIPRLLGEFSTQYLEIIAADDLSPSLSLQLLWDAALLRRLCERFATIGAESSPEYIPQSLEVVSSRIEQKLASSLPDDALSKFIAHRDTTVALQLSRLQVMLGPLFGDGPSSIPPPVASAGQAGAAPTLLLPLGTPLAEASLPPTMDLLKPGPRFQLLSVGGTSIR